MYILKLEGMLLQANWNWDSVTTLNNPINADQT
jgi:hypothetical protein